tara:strand:+ start:5038 stop:5814 length:777 start_codon:yes stop_codon:yes gene_type:complete
MTRLLTSLFLSGLLLLAGCGKVRLFSDLDESEVNDMIAILLEQGIVAEKSPGAEKTWDVNVNMQNFAQAVELLNSYGYPREVYRGVGEAFKKSGLVSSPTEERIRFMFALSQDISATIALIEGVTAAQVHIVLPDNDPFSDNFYPASAAVFVNYRPDSNVEASVSKIKNLVMNSVEGLSYDNISVALFPVSVVESSTIEEATRKKAPTHTWQIFWGLVLAAVLGGGIAAMVLFRRKTLAKEAAQKAESEASSTSGKQA